MIVLLLATFACAQLAVAKPKPNPNTYTGTFSVTVRGFWVGQGTANVSKATVDIDADVVDDDGHSGKLLAVGLKVVDNRFEGVGVVCGVPMRIVGRVEAQDPPPAGGTGKGKGKNKGNGADDQQVLTDARIGATFTTGTHGGRVAGSRGG